MDNRLTKFDDLSDVWDRSGLPSNVCIGEGCYLEINAANFGRFRSTCQPGLQLGRRVRVYDWTCFNVEPQGAIEVGDDSVLAGTLFMCAKSILIGRGVIVSYNVTIADCDFHPRDPDLRKQDAVANAPEGDRSLRPPLVARPVLIEDDVWIGIGAIILKGVHLGRGARVGAGAVVTMDVPAGATAVGNPARIVPEGPDAAAGRVQS
jgi:acetyltransferase-like isoleucine patch superfamily enzyme